MIFIENKYLLVKINEHGAELNSIFDKRLNRELLYQKTDSWQRQAPILFPIVGKLKEDTYFYRGYKYHLSQHGFARDRRFELIELSKKQAILELVFDDDTYKVYPFKFKLQVKYCLNRAEIIVNYRVINLDDYQMLYSIGGHPAFVVADYSDAYIRIDASKKTERYYLDGSYLLNSSTQFDTNISLDGNVQLANTYIFSNVKRADLKFKDYSIEVSAKKMPMFGVWASNCECGFVCLEPWWGVCDKNTHLQELSNKYLICFLAKHEERVHEYKIKIKDFSK